MHAHSIGLLSANTALEQVQRDAQKLTVVDLVPQVFLGRAGAVADPTAMYSRLAQLPGTQDYFDGGQHDSSEVLRVFMQCLHEDMVGPASNAALSRAFSPLVGF